MLNVLNSLQVQTRHTRTEHDSFRGISEFESMCPCRVLRF